MYQRIHFISGLPRSGSTLLAALLRQNSRFHAGLCGALLTDSILPPDLFQRFANDAFWRDPQRHPPGVRIV